MNSYIGLFDLLAVSANTQQSAMGSPQTLDTVMEVDAANVMNLDTRREDNSDALTGHVEADTIYSLGALSKFSIAFSRGEAQHFAFLYAYALGLCTDTAWGSGYKHLITPADPGVPPFFTGAFRYGKTIVKALFSDLLVSTVTSTFAKDKWLTLKADIAGSGLFASTVIEETVTAAYDATSLTLAANGVQGADAPTRLANVQRIRVQDPVSQEWVQVTPTAVSAAVPAVITITDVSPGQSASTIFKILYDAVEPAWATFPNRLIESPLRVSNTVMKLGGQWDPVGLAYLGGYTLADEIESIEHTITNTDQVEMRIGGTGEYANYALRVDRKQTLKLTRQMRDYMLQNYIGIGQGNAQTFAVRLTATGDLFATGQNYYVDMVFPVVGVLSAPISISDKVVAEAGDLLPMYDPISGYSVRVEVGNTGASYAAAA
jgi:hypothetical protein